MVFSVGIIISFVRVGQYLSEGAKTKESYSEIGTIMRDSGVVLENAESTDISTETLAEAFDEIALINKDYVGYIYISDTNIQYPLVRGEDNSFYLNRDLYRENNARGSIFMDYRNSTDFSDDNTIIYGHNMLDRSMFHDLMKFKDADFFEKSEPILITTKDEILEYKVFAMYKTDADTDYLKVHFNDALEFRRYLDDIDNRADLGSAEGLVFGDRLLTLSTCETAGNTYRYVVHAVLRR